MVRKQTGLVFDKCFLAHDTGVEDTVLLRDGSFRLSPQPHPSSWVITQRIKEFLDGSGLTARMLPIPARAATENELAVYHTRDYIAGIRTYAAGGPSRGDWGYADEDTILSAGSYEAALHTAGGAINALSAVLEGSVHNAYVLSRPPGHHATRNEALGFCVFNDAVIAVQHARAVYGLERVMIVDWDVHHGNGIQDAFYTDPNVLFISLHQQDWFPKGSGELEQVGTEAGTGFTVNIPLPPGTGDRGYYEAFEHIVLPIGRQFKPQCIVIVAGHDASWLDPLAHMMVTMDGYRHMSTMMVALAEEVCDGRLVMLQAGGYSAPYVPYCAVASVEPLMNSDLGIIDLYPTANELHRSQTIFSQDTQQSLQKAIEWHGQWWKL
jgi:acetoin utilization deacetylase AcuC-like enzyme